MDRFVSIGDRTRRLHRQCCMHALRGEAMADWLQKVSREEDVGPMEGAILKENA